MVAVHMYVWFAKKYETKSRWLLFKVSFVTGIIRQFVGFITAFVSYSYPGIARWGENKGKANDKMEVFSSEILFWAVGVAIEFYFLAVFSSFANFF